jgi:hypothetical protein
VDVAIRWRDVCFWLKRAFGLKATCQNLKPRPTKTGLHLASHWSRLFQLKATNPHSHGRDQEGHDHEITQGLEAGRTGLSFGTETRSKLVSSRVPKAGTRTKGPLPGCSSLGALGASALGKFHSGVAWPHFTDLISTSFFPTRAGQHWRLPASKSTRVFAQCIDMRGKIGPFRGPQGPANRMESAVNRCEVYLE